MELRVEGAARGWPRRPPVADDVARRLLREGEIDVLGRMPWSSNATFLACVSGDGGEVLAVYKPCSGERALWDFPAGTLAEREVATFETSEALGWRIVPDTVLRDGPVGDGMVQRFVDHDPGEHYFTLLEGHAERLHRFAVFDVVVNNADRKGGHVILGLDGNLWGIDHGVTFHTQWKLRTVIWEFASDPLGAETEADLRRLLAALDGSPDGGLAQHLRGLLSAGEFDAMRRRVEHLVAAGALPEADPGHHSFPWPLV